jgi:hypothetical protein
VTARVVFLLCLAASFAVVGLHNVAGYVIALVIVAAIIAGAVVGIGRARARDAAARAAIAARLEQLRRDLEPQDGPH